MKRLRMIFVCLVVVLTMCVGCSNNPCENCDDTPTKAYHNENTDEKEYYCADCSSECDLCGDEADKHYTGGGGIIFICNDCYDELKSYGWVD